MCFSFYSLKIWNLLRLINSSKSSQLKVHAVINLKRLKSHLFEQLGEPNIWLQESNFNMSIGERKMSNWERRSFHTVWYRKRLMLRYTCLFYILLYIFYLVVQSPDHFYEVGSKLYIKVVLLKTFYSQNCEGKKGIIKRVMWLCWFKTVDYWYVLIDYGWRMYLQREYLEIKRYWRI